MFETAFDILWFFAANLLYIVRVEVLESGFGVYSPRTYHSGHSRGRNWVQCEYENGHVVLQ